MKYKSHLIFSIAAAALIVLLSKLFLNDGGEFLTLPGVFIQLMLNVLLMVVSSEDDYIVLPHGISWFFNVAFYSGAIFCLLWLTSLIRGAKKTVTSG